MPAGMMIQAPGKMPMSQPEGDIKDLYTAHARVTEQHMGQQYMAHRGSSILISPKGDIQDLYTAHARVPEQHIQVLGGRLRVEEAVGLAQALCCEHFRWVLGWIARVGLAGARAGGGVRPAVGV